MNADANRLGVNWRQAIAEVSMIMIGILGALAVDSWSDERAERAAEVDYLQSLKTDFEANREELKASIKTEHRLVNIGKEIHSIIQADLTKIQQREIIEKIGEFYQMNKWKPVTGTYDEMMGSGHFSYIQNRELRIKLSKYAKSLEFVRLNEDWMMTGWDSEQGPFFTEHLLYTNLGWTGDYIPNSIFSENFQALETREFWNLVSSWMVNLNDVIRSYERAINDGNDILDLIDVELAKKNRNTG
jgi:hypothetical protein